MKEFKIDDEFVKVAVRLSGGGALYARSLYILKPNRVKNFIAKGTLKKVWQNVTESLYYTYKED